MKVLYVNSVFLPEGTGGTELHTFHLARELSRDHEVRVFTRGGDPAEDDYAVDEYEHAGIQVVRVNYNFKDATSFEWIWRNRRIEEVFAAELRRFSPDLVHIHHLTCLSTGIIDVVKDAGVPLVMTLHDFWMVCPRGQRIDPNLEICETVDRVKCHACLAGLWPHFFSGAPSLDDKVLSGNPPESLVQWDEHILRSLSRVDLMLTPSEFHRERMLEFDLPADRVEALPHGLDHALLSRERDVDQPIRTIGFIGSVIPSKGIHVLIDAFNRLETPGIRLVIHGEAPSYHGDTGYVDRLRSTVAEGRDVTFAGRYDNADLPDILSGIDVLVVPSIWWESFCLTIYEGLLSGTIVVASDHGAMSEVSQNGGDVVLFPPGDREALASCLDDLCRDEDKRRRFRNRGNTVKSLATGVRQTVEAYRRAIQRAGGDPSLADVPGAPDPRNDAGADFEGEAPHVTVFIPTYNGEEFLEEVLNRVFDQDVQFSYEVLCIDSGSKDATLEIISRFPVRLIEIPNSEFNHGLTRNRAVREAHGGIVALLTQDAVPYNDQWLRSIISNFDDPQVAGAYCHQIPREDCNPFQKDRMAGWTYGGGEPVVKSMGDRSTYESLSPMEKYQTIAFDDVASAVRKSVMDVIPFERRQFGEDVAWAKQAVLAGWKVVMDPRAVVVHSHNNSSWYEFKRVYLDHQNLNDLVGMHLVRRFLEVFRFTLAGTRHLGGVVRRSDLGFFGKLLWWCRVPFYSLGQNMGQYLGAKSSIAGNRGIWGVIDRFLKRGV